MTPLAYLDAGSGSVVLQAVLGGLAGVAVLLKVFGRKIARVFVFWRKRDPAGASQAAHPEPVSHERRG